ncbi:MAG: isopentenyl-diphosphate Delta-isomerase [Cyclobacteriaceae bacterium]
MDQVILVDQEDNEIGTMEKMEAHQKGLLHRAFSILIFNSKGEMLIQKRAKTKYHSGGLWTNTCCSHPLPQEKMEVSVRRRLKYEMGIDVLPEFIYKFTYRTDLNQDLIEHEVDYVFKAVFDGIPSINLEEVEDWKFIGLDELQKEIDLHPHHYTYWFKLIVSHPELREAIIN